MSLILSAPVATSGGHFEPPAPGDFWQPLWGEGLFVITRPMLVMLAAFLILTVWLLVATRRAAVVPGKGQWFVEQIYHFVREDIGRGMIGGKDFVRFMPLLFSLFTFILLNNMMGIIPPFQSPTMARIGFPIALVAVVYLTYHYVGIRKHGFLGYFKALIPPGLPAVMVPFIFILEFITAFITRPLTLTLRLFGNMFAGHMLLVLFILGGEALIATGGLMIAAGAGSFLMAALMTLFELLVEVIQAYVFTLLAASYIGASLADEH